MSANQRKADIMKIVSRILALTFAVVLSAGAAPARADQADKDACASLDEGDDCTRGDGGSGVCVPDESDPGVLTCDDDASAGGSGSGDDGSGDDSSGGRALACSASDGAPSGGAAPLAFALGAIALVAWGRRRLAHR